MSHKIVDILRSCRQEIKVFDAWDAMVVNRMLMCGNGELGTIEIVCNKCGESVVLGHHCGSRNTEP